MPTLKTVSEILQIARVAQYLAFKDQATKQIFQSGYKPPVMPSMITIESLCVQWQYDYDPNNAALQGAANYVYGLCGGYAIQAENQLANLDQAPPVVTGANNQSVQDNTTATFTIGVTSTLPYTIAWYKNGVLIPGATSLSYSFTAVLADTGNTYYAIVTDSAGQSVQSNTGVLTVSQNIVGYYYYGSTNYFDDLNNGIDNVPYQSSFSITDGSPLVVPFPLAASNNQYNIVKYPSSQSNKTLWNNSPSNFGTVPDAQYRSIISFGGWKYLISRTEMSLDSSDPTVTYS